MHNLGHYRESLLSFLKALNLDADHNHVDVLTNNIATIASQITPMPDKLMDKIPEMDAYKKLTEIGCCLYQGKKYDVCIKVLNSAQKLETNQKGITMRVQLTLANAHAALKHNELAVSLYQASNNETLTLWWLCVLQEHSNHCLHVFSLVMIARMVYVWCGALAGVFVDGTERTRRVIPDQVAGEHRQSLPRARRHAPGHYPLPEAARPSERTARSLSVVFHCQLSSCHVG